MCTEKQAVVIINNRTSNKENLSVQRGNILGREAGREVDREPTIQHKRYQHRQQQHQQQVPAHAHCRREATKCDAMQKFWKIKSFKIVLPNRPRDIH